MLYLENRSTDVYFNFGLELYLATEKRLDQPVLLLWRTSPTLMLGRYQNLYEEVDLDYARARGIHLVRRASGGGTIYTDPGGYQFSYIQRQSSLEISFAEFLSPLLAALHKLALPAEFSGRNDLLLDGRKFSGNAQFVRQGFLVHHGSILFDSDISEMERATRLPDYKIESKGIRSIRERVTNLRPHLPEGQDMSVAAFGEYLADELSEGKKLILAPHEYERVRALADSEFKAKEKIFALSPSFSASKSRRFAGGTLSVSFVVEKALIADLSISGDFFASQDMDDWRRRLLEALRGRTLEHESMREGLDLIQENESTEFVHRIRWGEIKAMLLDN